MREVVSPRILKIQMQLDKDKSTTIVIVYGPDEDDTVKTKEDFWEKINRHYRNREATSYTTRRF